MPTKIKIAALLQLLLIASHPLHAAVTMDGTLGRSGAITGPNYAITSGLGKQVGTSLFHSFSTFNLVKGDIATFSGPASVANIISRVTGGSSSGIDGTLKSTISGANVYFLNPAGVIFGPNASLYISGSFHVSTADYLKLGTDGRFDVAIPANSVLTTAPPSAFGFASAKPAGIMVNGAGSDYAYTQYGLYGLYVGTGNTISAIGGDIFFNSGMIDNQTVPFYLIARGGRLNVASVASSGEVVIENDNLAMNGFTALGNIVFGANGTIDTNPRSFSGTSGNIYIRGNNLQCNSFTIGSFSTDAYAGGNIDLRLTGDLKLDKTTIYSGGGQYLKANSVSISNGSGIILYGERDNLIETNKFDLVGSDSRIKLIYEGTNKGGGISINAANSINIGQGSISYNAEILTTTLASGSTGNISLKAPKITLSNFADVSSSTSLGGNAGDITITATDLLIGNGSTISGRAGSPLADVTGKSGNIAIKTDTLSMSGGSFYGLNSAAISNNCYGFGGCGNITIEAAKSLTMNGNSYLQNASITSMSNIGKAGAILINAPDMDMKNGIYISSNTADGQSGEIRLAADRITLQGGVITTGTTASGNAGSIFVTAREKLQVGGNTANTNYVETDSRIDSLSLGSGNAGSISITGKEVVIGYRGGVTAATENTTRVPTGKGGYISVFSDSLALEEGNLNAYTKGSGNAGNITINTAKLNVSGDVGGINSSTSSFGNGGSIHINSSEITIADRGSIVSQANSGSFGKAGIVDVTATGNLSIVKGGEISSSTFSAGDAGKVSINAGSIAIDRQSSSYNTGISSDAGVGSTGNAGIVDVTATGNLSIINGGEISSNIFSYGNAGNVTVNAGSIFIDGQGNDNLTGIFSYGFYTHGNAGSIFVNAKGDIAINNSGVISSGFPSSDDANPINNSGDGSGPLDTHSDSGQVKISAGNISIDGQASKGVTGIFSQANIGNSGNAGSVDVTATGNIAIVKGGSISSSTFSSGKSGTVEVDSGSIVIDGQSNNHATGIFCQANSGSTGYAGSIDVTSAGNLSIVNGGNISSGTFSSGHAGTVKVNAGSLLVDGTSSSINAKAATGSSGQTGSVSVNATDRITLSNGGEFSIRNDATADNPASLTSTLLSVSAPNITLKDSQITATSTGNVAASGVRISFTDKLSLDSGSISTSANQGNGGSINIEGGRLVSLDNSHITTSVQTLTGNGGNIDLTARQLVLDNSRIVAQADAGNGGNINLNADVIIQSPTGSLVSASSNLGLQGLVLLSSPILDVNAAMIEMPSALRDIASLSPRRCITGGDDISSFVVYACSASSRQPDAAIIGK